nr:MAG TPA_asm: hypothetical protein [Caudoviricetes sp.]
MCRGIRARQICLRRIGFCTKKSRKEVILLSPFLEG